MDWLPEPEDDSVIPRPFRPARARDRAGFSLVELIVVLVILASAMSIYSKAIVAVLAEQAVNRENLVAAEGVRSFLEGLRNEGARQVFVLHNADPSDDPGGIGTAPGSRFAVPGLDPDDSPDGLVGEVSFPTIDVAAPGQPSNLELRENIVNATFGTPRDLNGDNIIDALDHTQDYFVLPLEVVLRWRGKTGKREYRAFATLCEFNWE